MNKDNVSAANADPYYTSGGFLPRSSGGREAGFKVAQFELLLARYATTFDLHLSRIADVGCGGGNATVLLKGMCDRLGQAACIEGYDVHPQMDEVRAQHQVEGVSFHSADFCTTAFPVPFDLVVLFDVIEHVLDPLGFLRAVGQRSRLVALHVPLENHWWAQASGFTRRSLTHPGHLLMLDVPSTVNLVTMGGLRVRDFEITPAFTTGPARNTRRKRALYPLRSLLYRISPYLLQRLMGGVSLMVIAQTESGLSAPRGS